MAARAPDIEMAFQEKKNKGEEARERQRRVRCPIFNFHILTWTFNLINWNVLHGCCWLQMWL